MRRTLALMASLVAVSGQTMAQSTPKSNRPADKAAQTPATDKIQKPIELSQDVFRLETVGLSVNLPIGAQAQKSRIGEQITGQITPAPGDPQWLLTIQTPQSGNGSLTAKQVASEVLEQVRGQFGVTDDTGKVVRTKAEVLESVRELRLGSGGPQTVGSPARFYVKTPGSDEKASVVRGYTVLGVGKGRFVVFDLAVPEATFAAVRPTYEAMIATSRLEDPSKLSELRGQMVQSGQTFIAGVTSEQLDAAVAAMNDRWFRLYTPSTTGADADARENGYMRIRAWKGTRAEIEKGSKAGAEPDGYLVRLEARQLAGEQTVDSIGFYYVSLDRSQELWNLQLAVRDAATNKLTQTQTETGARAGKSMSVNIGGSGESRTVQPFVPEQGYLSQVEAFLLPVLLARSQGGAAEARELGFYTYQSEFSNVRLRRDAVRLDDTRAGAIRVTTQMNEDAEPFMSLFNENGELIQTTLASGTVRVPIELTRLVDVWKGKGLPVE